MKCWNLSWGHTERDNFIVGSWGHLIGKHPLSCPTLVSMGVNMLVIILELWKNIIEERIIFRASIRFLLQDWLGQGLYGTIERAVGIHTGEDPPLFQPRVWWGCGWRDTFKLCWWEHTWYKIHLDTCFRSFQDVHALWPSNSTYTNLSLGDIIGLGEITGLYKFVHLCTVLKSEKLWMTQVSWNRHLAKKLRYWNIIRLLKMLMGNYTYLHGKNSAYILSGKASYMTIYILYSIFEKYKIFTCIKTSERLYTKIRKMAISNKTVHEFNIWIFSLISIFLSVMYIDFLCNCWKIKMLDTG